MRYAVVIEKADGNYSAHVPDLPGCVATGETVYQVEVGNPRSDPLYIDGLKADGLSWLQSISMPFLNPYCGI